MNRRRRFASAIAAAVTAAAATTLVGAAATNSINSGDRLAPGFTLHGHVSGLYPGARRRLVIVVRNRDPRPLRLRSITTRVKDAKPGCTARNLRISAFRGRLRVGSGQARHVAVTLQPFAFVERKKTLP